MIASISSKGQVTIPVAARKHFCLHAGSRAGFFLTHDDRLEIIPIAGSVKQLKGMVPRPKKTLRLEEMDAVIAEGSRR